MISKAAGGVKIQSGSSEASNSGIVAISSREGVRSGSFLLNGLRRDISILSGGHQKCLQNWLKRRRFFISTLELIQTPASSSASSGPLVLLRAF
jgi:hypothetical protein